MNRKETDATIKRIEAKYSGPLRQIMNEAFSEFLKETEGHVNQDKLDLMMNLNASVLYGALVEPMYGAAGIIRR